MLRVAESAIERDFRDASAAVDQKALGLLDLHGLHVAQRRIAGTFMERSRKAARGGMVGLRILVRFHAIRIQAVRGSSL